MILTSGFVQMMTVTSSSMRFQGLDLSLGIRKTCGPFGTSSHTGLTQAVRLRKGYTLSGKEVYFCDVKCLVLFVKINLGCASQRRRLLLDDSEKESKRY